MSTLARSENLEKQAQDAFANAERIARERDEAIAEIATLEAENARLQKDAQRLYEAAKGMLIVHSSLDVYNRYTANREQTCAALAAHEEGK